MSRHLQRAPAKKQVGSMSVLVSGGAGFIGSHMVYQLRDSGEDVVVVDNLSTGFRQVLPPDVPLHVGDIGDENLVRKVIETHAVDAIIHFAGSIIVPESVADPLGYYHNNTVKSRNLIATAVTTGVKHFVFSSTAAVYGAPETNPVMENDPLKPMSPYGSSKLMTEMMLADTAVAHDFRYIALRYFNVAGADPLGRTGQSTPKATHLIKVACETALGKRPYMQVFGTDYPTHDGTCIRDYIHVMDLTHAHLDALRHLRLGGASNVFNCGYSRGFSVREVVDAVRRVSGKSFEVRETGRRPGDPPEIVANSDKLRATLGWKPGHDGLDEIVSHAYTWEEKLASLLEPA
jgi:UDP-glucose 4-epimerase